MLKKVIPFLIVCLFFVLLYFWPIKEQHFELSRFIDPDTCGMCHDDIFAQWQNSMHNLAHHDPIYEKIALFLRKDLVDQDEIAEAESCVKCHTPVGFVSGFPKKLSDDLSKTPAIAKKGIQCDYCHSAVKIKKIYNNGLELDPGQGEDNPGIKRGPLNDSKSDFHQSAFSQVHTESKICGTCHSVRHVVFKTKLETTYEEWFTSPYNSKDKAKRVTCQGCHMYQRPGFPATGSTARPKNPGVASSDGPEREHVFTHNFVGGNSFIPNLFKDSQKPKMVEERLQNAAKISLDKKNSGFDHLVFKVKNIGAGHYLPTGLTNIRQMWLEIVVKNRQGELLYSSGLVNENNYINEKKTILYNTIFGDGEGNPVINVSKAKEILKDKRIPPKEEAQEIFSFKNIKKEDLVITARLLYRSASQRLLDSIAGKNKMKLPIIVMAQIKEEIKFK